MVGGDAVLHDANRVPWPEAVDGDTALMAGDTSLERVENLLTSSGIGDLACLRHRVAVQERRTGWHGVAGVPIAVEAVEGHRAVGPGVRRRRPRGLLVAAPAEREKARCQQDGEEAVGKEMSGHDWHDWRVWHGG